MANNTRLNQNSTVGDDIATLDVGGVKHEQVIVEYLVGGVPQMVDAANPLPVSDAAAEAALASIAAEDFATQTTLASILAKIIAAPATEATLNAIGILLTSAATATKQDTGNATLASILAKIIAAPSTETKQDAIITLLTSIDAGTAAALGQALMAASVPVTIASNQTAIPISGTVSIGATDNTTLYSNDLAVTGAITGILTTGYQSIIFSFSGVWVGLLLIEGSEDNSIWEQKIVLDVNEFAMQDVINENGIFQIKSSSKYIRINVQQVSGTITVLIVGRTVPGLNAADSIAFAMDRSFNMPLYVEETATKKDVSKALIPSDAPAPIYGVTTAIGAVLFQVDTTGYQSVVIQAITVGTPVTVQTSNDGVVWQGVLGYNSSVATATITISAIGIWVFPALGKYVRGTVAGAAFTNCLVYLRQQPLSNIQNSAGQPINLQSINGTAAVSPSALTSTGGAGTLSGLISIGSSSAPGSTTVPYPIIVGGREAPSDGALSGKIRTLLTDTLGKAIVTGSIPAAAGIQNQASVPTMELSQLEGQSQIELLAQILLELRINNQYMSDLPLVLRGQSGSFDEPQQLRNDNSLFAIQ